MYKASMLFWFSSKSEHHSLKVHMQSKEKNKKIVFQKKLRPSLEILV